MGAQCIADMQVHLNCAIQTKGEMKFQCYEQVGKNNFIIELKY